MSKLNPEFKSQGNKAHVLIVDDMQVNRTILSSMLSSFGIVCDLAESGHECLEMCRSRSYDLILLDHRMPDMDGVDTLIQLKEIFRRSGIDTPVICHTADEGRSNINLYKAAGFADVLIKPIDPGQLSLLLMTYLPEGGFDIPADEERKKHVEEQLKELPDWLKTVPKLDLVSGIEHCDTAGDYLDALMIFAGSIKDKAAEIERYEKDENWPMYLLRIHSLKSVARLVGAVSIADRAADLEYAGRNEEYKIVHAGTSVLIDEYLGMLPRFKPLLSTEELTKPVTESLFSLHSSHRVKPMPTVTVPTIIFIGSEHGIVGKGIVKRLKDAGFKVTVLNDMPEVILSHRSDSNLVIYYPSGDIDHIKQVSTMLTEMCRDDNKTLCLTGDPLDIDAALKVHDSNYITTVYPRPVDLNQLTADMLKYSDIQVEYKRRKNILVIDDDADFLTIIDKWLSDDYCTDCVRSGMDALSYLEKSRPDLILLDYEMPVMNGYQVMERIRLNPRNEGIPIIFLTGKNDRESVMKILERRPDGYLLKSMPRDALLDSLDRFFAGNILTSP